MTYWNLHNMTISHVLTRKTSVTVEYVFSLHLVKYTDVGDIYFEGETYFLIKIFGLKI